jgi:hypothetical protein
MTEIKTYSITKRKTSNHFTLQNMFDIFLSSDGRTDAVQKHNYYTILIIKDAKGRHLIDDHIYQFKEKEIYFISPGQPYQVDLHKPPKGWVLTFSKDFLLRNNIPQSFVTKINLFNDYNHNPSLELDNDSFAQIHKILNEIKFYLQTPLNYSERALAEMLQLFLIHCKNSCSIDFMQFEQENRSFLLLRDFKEMVENKFKTWHKVIDYANEFHMSPNI